jgi:integration host factor subunit alpha
MKSEMSFLPAMMLKWRHLEHFLCAKKNARVGRNPRTGKEAEISARTVISFKPSMNLRKAVNA